MREKLLNQARLVVAAARKKGAQGVRASVYRSRKSTAEWRDGKLDRIRESTRMGLSITFFIDGRYSSNSTSDLRPEALERFVDQTLSATKLLASDAHRKLADPKRYKNRTGKDLLLYDRAGIESTSPRSRREIARDLESEARSGVKAGDIVSVSTVCSDAHSESVLVCSNGMEGSRRSTSFVMGAMTTVKDRGSRKPAGYFYAVARRRDRLPSVKHVGREATRRALLDRGGKPRKSSLYPCVIENIVAGRLIWMLLDPLRGYNIQQKRSCLGERMGELITSPLFSIHDEPHIPEGLGSCSYDNEGMSTVRMPLLEHGKLSGFFLDTYYASKLGLEPTTGGFTNLVFLSGDKDLEGLLSEMGTGLLITGFSGGNSNPATGDFSIGVRGQWIQEGKMMGAVSEMNLAGNHLSFWKQLVGTGDDPYLYSSIRCPSLRFDKVQFSGV